MDLSFHKVKEVQVLINVYYPFKLLKLNQSNA